MLNCNVYCQKRIFTHFAGIVVLVVLLCEPTNAQYSRTIHDGYTPTGVEQGAPAGSYPLGGFENVNLFNGSLNVAFPLLKVGGRGAAGYTMMLQADMHWELFRFLENTGGINVHDDAQFRAGRSWRVGYGPGFLIGVWAADKTPTPTEGILCGGSVPPYKVNYVTRFSFIMPDGSEAMLHDKRYQGGPYEVNWCEAPATPRNRGKVFVSDDGESVTFVSDSDISDNINANLASEFKPSGYLLMKDGTRYRVDSGRVSWIRDRNGNKLSFTYEALNEGEHWRMLTATDSLNRVVSITYATTATGYDQISFSGFGASQRSIKIWYSPIQNALYPGTTIKKAKVLFPEIYNSANLWQGDWDHNPVLVSKIELPDQRTYQFFYNSYGEVTRIILPTGGGFDYEYTSAVYRSSSNNYENVYGLMIYRRVSKRTVFNSLTATTDPATPPAGTREKIENYIVDPPHGYVPNPAPGTIIRVDVMDGNNVLTAQSKHYFFGKPYESENLEAPPIAYSWWPSGKEYKTESFNVSGGTAGAMLGMSKQCWLPTITNFDPIGWVGEPAPNPKLEESISILSETNLVAKQTFSYDQYNNRTHVWEHDYGLGTAGALLRHTETDYLTSGYDTIAGGINNPDPNATIHIRSLPTRQSVYDANGVERARTTYEYDTTPLGGLVYRDGITGLVSRDNQPPGLNYSPVGDIMRGNVTQVTRWSLGNTGLEQPDNNDREISTYSRYDIAGNLVETKDPNDKITEFKYDDAYCTTTDCLSTENKYTFAYVTQTVLPVSAAQTDNGLTVRYDYSTGKVVKTFDANDQVTTIQYSPTDALDRVSKVIRPALGGSTEYQYGDSIGSLFLLTKTEQNATTKLEDYVLYDGLGRAKRSAHKESDSSWSIRESQYDALGRVSQVSNPFFAPDYISGAGSAWTTTTYDALSRVTQVTTPDNASVKTVYLGNQVTVEDQAGKKRSSITDGLGRLVQVNEDPSIAPGDSHLNYQTNYAYDVLGNLIRVRQGGFPTGNSPDPTVQFRRFYYDSLSRLVYANNPEQQATIGFNPPNESGTMWTMKYVYDDNGNLTSRTDARGVITDYTYDALNRNATVDYSNTSTINPDIRRYYDTATNYGKGRLQSVESYAIHPQDLTLPPASQRRVDSRTIVNYDRLGRVISQQQGFLLSANNWSSFTATRVYDRIGHVLTQNYPSGGNVSYSYDASGRLSSFNGLLGMDTEVPARNFASGMVYNPAGQLESETFETQPGTFINHSMKYNVRFQMAEVNVGTGLINSQVWSRGRLRFFYGDNVQNINPNDPLANITDNNGNVARVEHWVPTALGGDGSVISYAVPMQDDYSYDAINRITKVIGRQRPVSLYPGQTAQQDIYQQTYSYDKFGNRKLVAAPQTWGNGINGTQASDIYDINKLTNQLVGGFYDRAGNLRVDPGLSLKTNDRTYDAENRMTVAKVANVSSYYVYDGDGRRVRRIVNGVETWQVYGIDGELLAEYQWNGSTASLKKEYGYRDGQLLVVGEPADGQTPLQVKWLVADHLGTPRMVVDKTGSLSGVTRHDYLPFGEELMIAMGNGGIRNTGLGYLEDSLRQKFTGYERDSESGLDFAEARYYANSQGRFINTDPLMASARPVCPQTWNRYTYVLNRPLSLVDTDGLMDDDPQKKEDLPAPEPPREVINKLVASIKVDGLSDYIYFPTSSMQGDLRNVAKEAFQNEWKLLSQEDAIAHLGATTTTGIAVTNGDSKQDQKTNSETATIGGEMNKDGGKINSSSARGTTTQSAEGINNSTTKTQAYTDTRSLIASAMQSEKALGQNFANKFEGRRMFVTGPNGYKALEPLSQRVGIGITNSVINGSRALAREQFSRYSQSYRPPR